MLDNSDICYIKALLAQEHCIYLDEIQDRLLTERGVRASIPTLVRTLQRLSLTHKCVSIRALERNAILRSAFMNNIMSDVPDPEMLMFIDEAAKNKWTSGRMKGWSLKGKRCAQRRCFVHGQRYSILLVMTLDGIISYDIIDGSVTAAQFVEFLCELLLSLILFSSLFTYIYTLKLPLTNPYPGPCSVIVLDNCSIHHTDEVRELIEQARKLPAKFVGT